MATDDTQADIRVTLEFTETFTIDELWPYGDYPAFVTPTEVEALMKQHDYRPDVLGFGEPRVAVKFKGFDLVSGRKTKYSDKLWTGNND